METKKSKRLTIDAYLHYIYFVVTRGACHYAYF